MTAFLRLRQIGQTLPSGVTGSGAGELNLMKIAMRLANLSDRKGSPDVQRPASC